MYLILEFYNAGNIILTDSTFTVIALTRVYEMNGETVKPGYKYTINILLIPEFPLVNLDLYTYLVEQKNQTTKSVKKDSLLSNILTKYSNILSSFKNKYIEHALLENEIEDMSIYKIEVTMELVNIMLIYLDR